MNVDHALAEKGAKSLMPIRQLFPTEIGMLSAGRRCLRVQLRGARLKSTSIKSLLKESEIGKDVTVTGWVTRRRKLKHALFVDVNDGSTFQRLQVVLPTDDTPETYGLQVISANFSVTVGSSIRVTGEVVASEGAGQDIELRAPTAAVLGTSEESPQVSPTRLVTDMSDFQFKKEHIPASPCVSGNIYVLE